LRLEYAAFWAEMAILRSKLEEVDRIAEKIVANRPVEKARWLS
jgi:hypothetical protein